MRRALVPLIATVALSACGTPALEQDRPTDTPTSSINVRPNVPTPPGLLAFPDFNAFRPADVDAYSGTNSHGDRFVTFKTEAPVTCFAYLYGTRALGAIECNSIELPGFPADARGQDLRQTAPPGTVFTDTVVRAASNEPFEFRITRNTVDDSAKTLPAGQRLVVNDSGCAVGDDDLLACIDGDHHGFVVSPRGSWAF
jgi:hypothetical protein